MASQNIIASGAQITWVTSVSSDSRVAYGTSSGGYTLYSDSRCDMGGYVTSHCVNLTGLSPSTVYYYKVESRDSTGNDNMLGGFKFTSAVSGTADPTLPIAPSSLAISLDTNGLDATLSWADNSSDEEVFKIYNRPQGNTSWVFFTSVERDITTVQYIGHPFGTYEYYVSSCNIPGCSLPSNIAVLTKSSIPDTTAPSMPTNVTASALSSSEIALSWGASTDNISVTGYNIYRNGDFAAKVDALSYTDKDLTPATLYRYTVAAADAANNFSPKSTEVKATTYASADTVSDTTPPVISGIEAKNIMAHGAQIVWTTDDPSGSSVAYGTSPGLYPFTSTWRCDAGGSVITHCVNLAGLSPKTAYYYQVISSNIFGYESKSPEGSFTSADGAAADITATTTETALIPVTVSAKAGEPYCLYGFTVGSVAFAANPPGSSYFALSGGLLSSPQKFTDGGGNVMPYGTYTWKAIPKTGYSVSADASGTFTIPKILSCSVTAAATTTASIAETAATTTATAPHAYIALRQGEKYIGSGEAVSGSITINIGVEGAKSVAVYIQKKGMTVPRLLGSAVRAPERQNLWKFLWDSKTVSDGEAAIFSRVANTFGEYKGDSASVNIKNGSTETVTSIQPKTTAVAAPPAEEHSSASNLSAAPPAQEIPKSISYQETEAVLRKNYQEAEDALRKRKGIAAGTLIKEEEKRELVREVRAGSSSFSVPAD
ncbi:MAG: fibronectin type III domain-containing protein, partial [Parcubacteria group bacterium]|nr:fibronectin type III domain-containing protein [Parcubacteria group bacterium]